MKFLIGLFVMVAVGNLSAANLCNTSCSMSITFPDGGSIQVDEETVFTFGSAAFINNGTSTVSYPAGEVLEIDDDESLTFSDGGEFDIGRGGNIDHEDLKITSNGDSFMAANEGGMIIIDEVSLDGDLVLNLASDFKVLDGGKLRVKDGYVVISPELMFINLGEVKGRFHFSDSVIHYLKDIESYNTEPALTRIIEELAEGRENLKEIEKSVAISGEIYLDTKKSFILLPAATNVQDIPDIVDETDPVDRVINIDQPATGGQFDNNVLSDSSAQPLNKSVSIASSGSSNLFMLMLMVVIRLTFGRVSSNTDRQGCKSFYFRC